MRSRYTIPGLAALLLLGWSACTLNPQPLPPAFSDKDNGAGSSGGEATPSTPGDDAGRMRDAGPAPFDGGAVQGDGGAVQGDGGVSEDAGDGGSDAGPKDAGTD